LTAVKSGGPLMSRNVFQYLGQTLAEWLRAFANKIQPKAETGGDAPAHSSSGNGPPAHWLERVRQDAPQLLHPAGHAPLAPRAEQPPPADVTERSISELASDSRPVPPATFSTWPNTSSRTARTDASRPANVPADKIRAASPDVSIPEASRPIRPAESSYPAQKEKPVTTHVSHPFTRLITHRIGRQTPAPIAEGTDKRVERTGSEQKGFRFPPRVLHVERTRDAKLEAALAPLKQARSFSEAPRWPAQQTEAASISAVQFPASARATPRAGATFPELFERPPGTPGITTNNRFVHKQIAIAAVAFPQETQADRWPALLSERDPGNVADRAADERDHLQRLEQEQKGKLWIA